MKGLDELQAKIDQLRRESQAALERCQTLKDCESVRVRFLGRKGAVTTLFDELKGLGSEERPQAGRLLNELKGQIEAQLEAKRRELAAREVERKLEEERIDVTLPGRPARLGHAHVLTQTLHGIYRIFAQMGFEVYQTREVETDEMNFQLLNIPPDHPAREMQSTFYTTQPGVMLRTHTSPGQIRVMRERCPEPIRVILPGKCYRYEQITPRSEIQFYQVEGLAVGHNITMSDLKGVLTEFARQMFGPETAVKLRGSYFPFTEPSVELDIRCILCEGQGCRVCKETGWLEILGAGMVHPVVLQNGGYDPERYSGFAFGMGPERIAMLKHRIEDIRLFLGNDLRFLEQFG
jgi:phenylalanyl-tRNA synthetase alpha chain